MTLNPSAFLTPGALGSAIETTVANIASPTELNSLGTAQGEIRLARTTEAGTGTQTWYYLDTTSDAQNLPYIVTSATAGLKWIAFGGRYQNEAFSLLGAVVMASTLNVIGAVTLTVPLASTSGGTGINNAGTITNASNTTITGGGTLALGGFTLTVPATGTVGLLGAGQTWSGANVFSNSAGVSVTGTGGVDLSTAATSGVTVRATTGTTLTILSTTDSTSASTGSIVASGGITSKKTVYMSNGCIIESQSSSGLLIGTAGVSTKGSTICSAGGTSANYNGMFFNSNAAGSGDTGSQYNTGLPTWRMALGGGSSEWNGADCFAIARVAAGGTVTTPTLLFKLSSAGLGTFTGGVTHGSATLLTTTTALTNGAAAQSATMTNGPTAGNPTKWIPINDNGTTRYIPAW